ncbi:hypothetical protein MRB53_001471 [Persea americana]|uniref:Uncharacterized protein n=1 Tax=Persea americana TaxID=3435 RepID=A0ACC2MSS9_PERAE|nr:hypothetical protein MRB53_001471 [Persea americana]
MRSSTIRLSGFDRAVSKEEVKKFLEDITGKDTVVEIKPRPPKNTAPTSRAFAIVQFTASKFAEDISSQAKQRLLGYEGSYLTVRQEKRDIIQRPTISKLQNAVLHVGCMVSAERFSSLWSVADVQVTFEFRWQKLQIFLSYNGLKYKLELLDQNIRQIQLHHQSGQATKFLLIQVRAAPRVYKKDAPENHWDRTVDFTPQCSIGQSSALCLEVPYSCELPDLRKNFIYFKENEGQFILVEGSSYCNSFDLVPMVTPGQNIQLQYSILFKINSLVQNGIIMGPTLNDEFFSLLNPYSTNNQYIDHALEALAHLKDTCFEPTRWLREQYRTFEKSGRLPKLPAVSLDRGLVYIHRVQVTPTKVYFCGPEVNSSNRVLRRFSNDLENFIRVSFVDEDWDKIHSKELIRRTVPAVGERHTSVYERILSTLRNGIVIGDKKFEFLAYSSSQLKENSVWMFAARSGLTAADIRKWMGDFSTIRNVAKYAARLGQSFGSSQETLTVMKNEIENIPDIKTEDKKYNFSDGIGKISVEFAERIASLCGLSSTPSAFQIRYAGYKGVVACDPNSSYKLSLRKESMCKYVSENTKLDILAWSKYQPCFLNRQVITLLSTLGVKDRVFQMKQQQAVHQLDEILTDPGMAHEALEVMSPGENSRVLREMLRCGYKPDVEPYLSMMLQNLRASKLWELRTKTRIFTPKGRTMMGSIDETGTLEYGQVFVNISRVERKRFYDDGLDAVGGIELDTPFVLVGKVFVAKNPCLYPGDLRVLFAVDVPALHHMVDCIVFPQKGKRPHPNECSGSDLDGDLYVVSWDPLLIPPRQIPPLEYMPVPTVTLDRDVEIEEVMEHFANYMVNDSVGVISNAHLVWSDKEPLMAESDPCKKLAIQSSIAVDYAKTGVPAEFPPHLHVKEYPDFMEKPNGPTYKSKRVIGKLFRAIKNIAIPTVESLFTKEDARKTYDPDMEVEGFENYIEDARFYKEQYGIKLCNLMDHYGIKTEAEIVSGNLLEMTKSYTKKKDGETIELAMKTLTKEVRTWFDEKGSKTDPVVADDVYAKASAWYHVTYHPDYFNEETNGAHFFSFPWRVPEILMHIKKKKLELTGEAE